MQVSSCDSKNKEQNQWQIKLLSYKPPSKAFSGPDFSKLLLNFDTVKFSFFQPHASPDSKLHDTVSPKSK